MDDRELIQALRRMVPRDKFQCLGCGHEHRCSIHGCAILKQAVERLEQLTTPPPNGPRFQEMPVPSWATHLQQRFDRAE